MINTTINSKNNPRKINHIVVHCTGTSGNTTIESIERYWRTPKPNGCGWRRPGYHYIVKADGSIVSLLPETFTSNGVGGHNAGSVHISYIGGIDAAGKTKDTRTPHQRNALSIALRMLKAKYPDAIIQGHRDFPGVKKDCPAFDAKKEYAYIKA